MPEIKKDTDTALKVSVLGVFLVRIFSFGLNTDQKNSEYGHFSLSLIVRDTSHPREAANEYILSCRKTMGKNP